MFCKKKLSYITQHWKADFFSVITCRIQIMSVRCTSTFFCMHANLICAPCTEDAFCASLVCATNLIWACSGHHLEFSPNCWTLAPASGRPFARRRSIARAAPNSACCGTPPWRAGRSGPHLAAGCAAAPLRKLAHLNLNFAKKKHYFVLVIKYVRTSFLDAQADAAGHQKNENQAGEYGDDGTNVRVKRRVSLRFFVDQTRIRRSCAASTQFLCQNANWGVTLLYLRGPPGWTLCIQTWWSQRCWRPQFLLRTACLARDRWWCKNLAGAEHCPLRKVVKTFNWCGLQAVIKKAGHSNSFTNIRPNALPG